MARPAYSLRRIARIAAVVVLVIGLALGTLEAWLSGPLGMSGFVLYRSLRNTARDLSTPSPPSLADFSNAGPNVVILILDCFRFDYLPDAAPTLRQLADRAWSFDRYFTSAPWTKPSTASLFTGLLARKHYVGNPETPLPPDALTLAELLRDHGWKTAGFIWHNPHLARRQGFDQGFDHYSDDIRPAGSKAQLHRFLSWLEEERPERFFAYVHFEGTHDPYVPDNTLDVLLTAPRYSGDLDFTTVDYKDLIQNGRPLSADEAAHLRHLARGKARKVDEQVVREFLARFERSPLRENTLLIISADHGDAFYEHGTVSHGGSIFDEEIHVPLVMAFPERFARERSFEMTGTEACPVSTVDLLPTVLDFVGVEAPPGIDGISIIPGRNRRDPCERPVVSEQIGETVTRAALVSKQLKLIVDYASGSRTLYDLDSDPGETRDLSSERTEQAAALETVLATLLNPDGSSMARWQQQHLEVPEEERQRLRVLGYEVE